MATVNVKINREMFAEIISENKRNSATVIDSTDNFVATNAEIKAFSDEFKSLCVKAFYALDTYAHSTFSGAKSATKHKNVAETALKACFCKLKFDGVFDVVKNPVDVFMVHLYGFKSVKDMSNADNKTIYFCSSLSANDTATATAVKNAMIKFIACFDGATVIENIDNAKSVKDNNYVLSLTKKAIKAAESGRDKAMSSILDNKIKPLVSAEKFAEISADVRSYLKAPIAEGATGATPTTEPVAEKAVLSA